MLASFLIAEDVEIIACRLFKSKEGCENRLQSGTRAQIEPFLDSHADPMRPIQSRINSHLACTRIRR